MSQKLSNLATGAKVKFGSLHGATIVWMVVDKNHSGYPSNSVTVVSDQILRIMAFDAAENSASRYYGNNDYVYSNIRQWLNSAAAAGQWYTAQHSSDAPPSTDNLWNGVNPYDTIAGFLNGFTANEQAAILTTDVIMKQPSFNGGGTVTGQDKMFLMSGTEVGSSGTNASSAGKKLAYFTSDDRRKATVTAECVANSNYDFTPSAGSNGTYWTRDCDYFDDHMTYIINTSGKATNSNAYNGSNGLRPVCNLSGDQDISDSTDADGCYTLVFNTAPTTPSSITVPSEVYGGRDTTISWGASSDVDGNLSGYILEQKVDSGAWAQIYSGVALSYTVAITYGSTSVQYRVKAYDTMGAESAYATSATRTVTNNRTPVISGSDSDLGSFIASPPSYSYTVTDEDGDAVTVVEKLDGTTRKSYTATLGSTNSITFTAAEWQKILNGSHTLTITTTDPKGATATRTITFTKAVTTIEFVQTVAMAADDMPTRALLNVQGYFPEGCTLTVWMCNNGNDASPTWQDVTAKALNGEKIFFSNTEKTADAWGVKVKAQLLRGTATETCYITSIGGNFA